MNNLSVKNMRCENLVTPIGIDIPQPVFSFIPVSNIRNQEMRAYRIICSVDYENIKNEKGDMWDSGTISGKQNFNIKYAGNKLNSCKKYYWRVKWWDKSGNESQYSEITFFETALLNKEDFCAKWINKKEIEKYYSKGTFLSNQYMGDYEFTIAQYLRKEFTVKKNIKNAKIFVSGLGYYELSLNGKKVGNNVLDPGQTDYQCMALYSVYNIADSLQGNNCLGIILGNGRHIKYYGFPEPKFYLQLNIEYTDGTFEKIISDESWKASTGALTENGIYNGERYDARKEMPGWNKAGFKDSSWDGVKVIDSISLRSQLCPPIRVCEYLKPQKMWSPKEGSYVYDFGQNFSGWIRLNACGPEGTEIKMRFAENIYEDGNINTLPNEKAECTDIYIMKGEDVETYEPKFTYHGFRFVELTGFPGIPDLNSVLGCFVHSDVEKDGDFITSNELINKIHNNIIWGQLSNLMSVPTDCSQRDERHGWMGDAHLSGEAAIFNFDMYSFYKKYLNDIKISQKEDGSIPDVVPPYYRHLYPADPGWGAAYIIFVWFLYQYYGDKGILEEHYESLKKYIESMKRAGVNHILKNSGKYGDWCPPGSVPPKMTTPEFTATWFYYHDSFMLLKIANILDKKEDVKYLEKLTGEIKDAFNNEYLKNDMYQSLSLVKTENHPSQTSHALPLYLNMPPEDKKEVILQKLLYSVVKRNDCHVDTGIIGTRYLLEVLSDYGYFDIAYKVATQKSYPSWGYMVSEGATTLWERWEKLTGQSMNSHNHIMFGSIDAWFYKYLAGISPKKPGWEEIKIKPNIPGDLEFVSASTMTPYGMLSVSWKQEKSGLKLFCNIPVGTKAEIYIPKLKEDIKLTESGSLLFDNEWKSQNKEIEFLESSKEHLKLKLGSGFYSFSI
jgi:alpha-L-rhamnosidase